MIQFNLLPDVKIAYIKARRVKRLVGLVSRLIMLGSLGLMVFVGFIVFAVQKTSMNNLNKDIKSNVAKIQSDSEGDIEKVLTIQAQLSTLPGLHDEKPIASRLFGFMNKLTPATATISKVEVDFALNSIEIGGAADKLSTINQFVDTLKFTKYRAAGSTDVKDAFPPGTVILAGYGRDEKGATYKITLTFDPEIFDGKADEIELLVPNNLVTTRSETERPLFQTSEPAPDINAEPDGGEQ